jgi:hypothetical protein
METPPVYAFNSLIIVVNEFGVFLPAWDSEFMNTMTDLWDCGRYHETKRTNKISNNIPNTQLNMLSATTPAQLTNLLPQGAWEQGFMARVLIVFSSEQEHTDLFQFEDVDEKARGELITDLRDIYKMFGRLKPSDEYKEAINEWCKAGGPPAPEHPNLMTYRIRRAQHLLKLSMVASAAGSSDGILTLDNFAEALDWLVELETYMPDVFKSMTGGGDGRAIEECYHYAYQLWIKHKTPIPEARIIAYLQERVPAHNIDRILDVMERAELLKKQFTETGGKGYIPKARKAA